MAAILDTFTVSGLPTSGSRPDYRMTGIRAAIRRHWAPALGVLAVHGLALLALYRDRLILVHPEAAVTVSFIEAPRREPRLELPKPPRIAPAAAHLVFEAPRLPVLTEVADPAGALTTAPVSMSTSTAPVMPSGPALLSDELAVFCPVRTPPVYPLASKHRHEQGEVTLRVELDESGKVSNAIILKSSGSAGIDEAARVAVLTWRCDAALRDGKPVRAVAIQSLEFVLEPR